MRVDGFPANSENKVTLWESFARLVLRMYSTACNLTSDVFG